MGLFDDLVPQRPAGLFDDLVPQDGERSGDGPILRRLARQEREAGMESGAFRQPPDYDRTPDRENAPIFTGAPRQSPAPGAQPLSQGVADYMGEDQRPEPEVSIAPQGDGYGQRGLMETISGGRVNSLENVARGALERTGDLGGGLLTTANVLSSEVGLNVADTAEGLVRFAGGFDGDADRSMMDRSASALEGFDLGYVPEHTWEDVKKEFGDDALGKEAWGKVAGFAFEQGIKSAPDMVAAALNLPLYAAARTGEIARERAANKGLDEPGSAEVIEASPFAIGSAILERIVPSSVLQKFSRSEIADTGREVVGEGLGNAIKHVAREGGTAGSREALTEAIQEGVLEYLGGKWGTGAEMSLAEAVDRGGAGAVAGGGYGSVLGAAAGAGELSNQPPAAPTEAGPGTVEGFDRMVRSQMERDRAFDEYGVTGEEMLQSVGGGPSPLSQGIESLLQAGRGTRPPTGAEVDAANAGIDPGMLENAPPEFREGMEDASAVLDDAVQSRADEAFSQPQPEPQPDAGLMGATVRPREGAQPIAQTGDPMMDYRPEDLVTQIPEQQFEQDQQAAAQAEADALEQEIDRSEEITSSVPAERLPKVRRREGGSREWDDARLKRKSFREGLQAMSSSLRRGGGSMGRYDTYEGDRPREGNEIIGVPSENPRWFQGVAANEGISVDGAQKAVDKALKGRPLGEREARVVETMLDIQSFERMGGNTETGEGPDTVSFLLSQFRDQRRADRGQLTDAEIDARAEDLADRDQDMLGQFYTDQAYEADMARADRALYDLAQDAAAVDEAAVTRILESNRDETESIRELWEITQRGRDGQGNEGLPGEQGQGAQEPAAQQGQEARAPTPADQGFRLQGQVAPEQRTGRQEQQADAFDAPTENQQGAEQRRQEVQGRLQGQGSPDMMQGGGELFAGPRPEQADVFGEGAQPRPRSRQEARDYLEDWIGSRAKQHLDARRAQNYDDALKRVSEDIRAGRYPDWADFQDIASALPETLDRETGERLGPDSSDWPRTGTLLDFLEGQEQGRIESEVRPIESNPNQEPAPLTDQGDQAETVEQKKARAGEGILSRLQSRLRDTTADNFGQSSESSLHLRKNERAQLRAYLRSIGANTSRGNRATSYAWESDDLSSSYSASIPASQSAPVTLNAYKALPETTEAAPDQETDRRSENEKRRIIQNLPPEQQEVLLRSDVIPALRGKRAFEIHQENNPDERVLFFDFDDFKAVNDRLGEDETDAAVLEPAGEIIQAVAQDAGINAYHRSGDEFLASAATDEQLTQFAESLRERLKGARLEATLPDGTKDTIEGIEFSYGTGQDEQTAREASKKQKAERRRAGQRTGARDQGVGGQAPEGDQVSTRSRGAEGRVAELPPDQPAQESPDTPPDGGVSRSGQPETVEAYGEEGIDLRRRQDRQQSLERELTDDDLANMPLSKIWPKKEVDAIEDIPTAAFMTAIRSYIPAKPRKTSGKRQWVSQVKTVRELGQMYQSGRADEIMEQMKSGRSKRDPLAQVANQAELLQSIPRDQWSRIGPVAIYPDAFRFEGGEQVPSPHATVRIDKRTRRFSGAETVADVVEGVQAILQDQPARRTKMQFEIRQRRADGIVFINKKGDPERRPLREFDSVDEARTFLRDNPDQLEQAWEQVKERDNVKKTDVRRDENREREGKDRRDGRDVTTEEFAQEFGLRHVDFGKWVGQGKDSQQRQRLLNEAYDALMDLSDVLGVPSEAVGLNGSLIVTFGKRGTGWASAHFEPKTELGTGEPGQVINLTKTRGAGSLAHEWFHALDNYFRRQRGDVGNTRETNYVTYAPEPMMVHKSGRSRLTKAQLRRARENNPNAEFYRAGNWERDPNHPEGIRPEVEESFARLVEALDESPMAERANKLDKGKDGYWGRVIERAARSFENYVIDGMAKEGIQNDFLANVTSIEDFQRDQGRYPYLKPDEIRPVAEAFDDLFSTLETRETDQGTALYSFAGSRARTADQNQLIDAKQRIEAGDAPDVVRRETGWFQGADGRWRFEINDIRAELQVETDESGHAEVQSHLGTVLKHDRLFQAYPELAGIRVSITVDPSVESGRGHLARGAIDGIDLDPEIRAVGPSRDSVLSVLLHEVQHGIQSIEGFATGGNVRDGARLHIKSMRDDVERRSREIEELGMPKVARSHSLLLAQQAVDFGNDSVARNKEIKKARAEFMDAVREEAPDQMLRDPTVRKIMRRNRALERRVDRLYADKKRGVPSSDARRTYQRLAGEVEARNVQARRGMTDTRRRDHSPESTTDVPADEVIVAFNGEVMENAPPPANASETARSQQGPGTTPESFREAFTPRAQRALFDSGLVTVTQSPTEWPGSHPADAAGAWINGKVYVATDNVRPGAERGLMLHEIGVHHGLQDMLGDDYGKLVGRLKTQVRRGGRENATRAQREAYQAHQRALADETIAGDDTAMWEETIAYMAESGADTPLLKRIGAAVRRFLRRMGLVRDFSNADVADLARGSVERVMAGELDGEVPVYAQARYQRADRATTDQTQTPEFRRWFGDSKVVDSRGRPKVVYHGSPDARGIFGDRPGFQSPGERFTGQRSEDEAYFFTDSRVVARTYADDSRAFDYQNAQNAVLQTYLSLQNPMEIDAGGRSWGERGGPASQADQIAEAKRLGHDGMIIRNTLDTYNVDGNQRATVYVAFEPTQIKSAESGPVRDLFDGSEVPGSGPNTGAFDPSNPDIRYSRSDNGFVADPANPNQPARPGKEIFSTTVYLGRDSNGKAVTAQTSDPSLKEQKALKKHARRLFTKEGLLTPQAFARHIETHGLKNADEVDVQFFTHDVTKRIKRVYGKLMWGSVPQAEMEKMNEYLAGQDVEGLDDRVTDALDVLRGSLDRMSGRLQVMIGDEIRFLSGDMNQDQRVEFLDNYQDAKNGDEAALEAIEGLPHGDQIARRIRLMSTIEENKGSYLNRSYRVFDDPNWRPDAEVMGRARTFLRDQVNRNPEFADLPDNAKDDHVEGIINSILNNNSGGLVEFLSSDMLGRKDLSVLKRRKEIAPEIRELMGEHKDPRLNFARSMTKMSGLVANHHFLSKVREDGLGAFLSTRQSGLMSVQIAQPGDPTMLPMGGLWATPDFAQAMRDYVKSGETEAWLKAAYGVNASIKYGKTVLSPTTSFRNFWSAAMFTVMNGHSDYRHSLKAAQHTWADLASRNMSRHDYIRKLAKLGVLHDNPRAAELEAAMDDAMDMDPYAGGMVKRAAKVPLNIATRIYRAGDDFWKIIGFENEKANLIKTGMSEVEAEKMAADRIRNGYPTYSMVPAGIRWVRRFPLAGTFVSFPWEIMRTTGHQFRIVGEDLKAGRTKMAAKRMVGMSAAGAGTYAISSVLMSMFGIDDEDDEAIRELAAPWQRNSQLAYLPPDEDGNVRYLDLTHLDPYAYLKLPLRAIMNGNNEGVAEKAGQALKEMLEPFIGSDIGATALVDVWKNKKAGTGAPVYDESATTAEQGRRVFNYLREALQPGIFANMERTLKAVRGEVTSYGKEYKKRDEVLGWVGFRLTTSEPDVSLKFRSFDFKDAYREALSPIYRTLRDPNPIDDSDVRSAVRTADERWSRAFSELHSAIRAAKVSGMTDREIARVLSDARVAKKHIRPLVSLEVPPWEPSSQSLNSAAKAATTGRNTRVSRSDFRKRLDALRAEYREIRDRQDRS